MDSKFGFNGVMRLVSIGLLAAIPGRFLACAAGLPAPAEAFDQAATNNAIVPVTWLERDSYNWDERHAQVLELQKTLDPEVVLIGDSITHFWAGPSLSSQQNGPKTWADTFGGHRVLNMGFGWDRTQNVLWRLAHGEFAGQTPRLVVLLIGTLNRDMIVELQVPAWLVTEMVSIPLIIAGITLIVLARRKAPEV